MAPKWSTLASHIAYGAVVVYYVGTRFDKLQMWSIPYTILLTRSLVGIIDTVMEQRNDTVGKIYNVVDKLMQLFLFPCFVGSMWMSTSYNYHYELAMFHPILSLIPLIMYVTNKNDENLITTILTLNLVSGILVGFLKRNWWCVGAAVVFGISHGLLRINDEFSRDLAEDTANFILAGYTYLTIMA